MWWLCFSVCVYIWEPLVQTSLCRLCVCCLWLLFLLTLWYISCFPSVDDIPFSHNGPYCTSIVVDIMDKLQFLILVQSDSPAISTGLIPRRVTKMTHYLRHRCGGQRGKSDGCNCLVSMKHVHLWSWVVYICFVESCFLVTLTELSINLFLLWV